MLTRCCLCSAKVEARDSAWPLLSPSDASRSKSGPSPPLALAYHTNHHIIPLVKHISQAQFVPTILDLSACFRTYRLLSKELFFFISKYIKFCRNWTELMGFFKNLIITKQISMLYTVKEKINPKVDANFVQKRKHLQQVLPKLKIMSLVNCLKSSMHSTK